MHGKCTIFFKILAWGIYLGLGIFAIFSASGVWDKYNTYASSFMFLEEKIAESPTITFEIDPRCNIGIFYGIDDKTRRKRLTKFRSKTTSDIHV